MTRISIISAMAQNRVIGIDNSLPWSLKEDLQHFKQLTMGHSIIMGRKTFESIGKPLPGRRSIIVTRNPAYQVDGCTTVTSLEAAFAACDGEDEAFIIGGAELYGQALPHAHCLYLTEIKQDFIGDAYFPLFDRVSWQEVKREPHISESGLQFDFVEYHQQP